MKHELFGLPVKYEQWNKENSLPLYITGNYEFQTMIIDTQRCVLLTPKNELATLPALKKHIQKIQDTENLPVVFSLSTISSYRRKNMIENRIPFVSEKQIFLPFIGTFLTAETEPTKMNGKFFFSTQQLFLLYIYKGAEELYVSDATEQLPYTAMTLSRAVKQLEACGLFDVTKSGTNKVIRAKYEKSNLFKRASQYLSSPIRTTGYIMKQNVTNDMVYAGETALSEKTMLNPTRTVTYAISAKEYDKKKLTDELIDPNEQVHLELWEYSPNRFAVDNFADSLSVALSLRDSHDERIQEAIEELLETEWNK